MYALYHQSQELKCSCYELFGAKIKLMLRIHELFLFTLHKICLSILNLFDLSLKLSGFPIKKAELVLRDIQNKTETDFEAYIEEKKQAIVKHHLKQIGRASCRERL